jgi:hypothetical protein
LEAVKNNGSALEFASNGFQNDKEIILEALKKNGAALEFTSKEFQNDKDFVFLSIENIFKTEKLDLDHFKTELIQILLKDKVNLSSKL